MTNTDELFDASMAELIDLADKVHRAAEAIGVDAIRKLLDDGLAAAPGGL